MYTGRNLEVRAIPTSLICASADECGGGAKNGRERRKWANRNRADGGRSSRYRDGSSVPIAMDLGRIPTRI